MQTQGVDRLRWAIPLCSALILMTACIVGAVLPVMYCPNCPRDRRYEAPPCSLCEGKRRISFVTKWLRSSSR
jgi:hypothetical protein